MEIDRIDKDNIRVFLVHKDLEERGVTILDLLGNQMQVEKFFYSILEEVDTDHTFSGTQSITFQVMPNEDGLELLISKSPQSFDKKSNHGFINPANLFDVDSNMNYKENEQQNHNDSPHHSGIFHHPEDEKYFEALKPDSLSYIAKFNSIDDLIDLGRFLTLKVKSQLFLFKGDYYAIFTLYKKDSNRSNYSKLITNVNEYGTKAKISPEILAEHGKVLIKNNIFKTLDKFF